ncbi:MAG: MOSC domain-containing protein, partial [Chloroflexaceae bacterium]|nr:MOSC domain-containing protein [Chloroflexaceae bacterium]
MRIHSVNVSMPTEIEYRGRMVSTGIFKEPIDGRVMLRRLNLDGDGQADLVAHGGVHKAAYIYPLAHYAYWQRELGRDDFTMGQFGENFTVEGMDEDSVSIGDRYRFGAALVEVSQPRSPCFKLGIRMGAPDFLKPFLQSSMVGFYVRVLEAGEVGAGDQIELVARPPDSLTVRQINHLYYFDKTNVELLRRAEAIETLSPGWREGFAEIL